MIALHSKDYRWNNPGSCGHLRIIVTLQILEGEAKVLRRPFRGPPRTCENRGHELGYGTHLQET